VWRALYPDEGKRGAINAAQLRGARHAAVDVDGTGEAEPHSPANDPQARKERGTTQRKTLALIVGALSAGGVEFRDGGVRLVGE
jgi:hypothetical protein